MKWVLFVGCFGLYSFLFSKFSRKIRWLCGNPGAPSSPVGGIRNFCLTPQCLSLSESFLSRFFLTHFWLFCARPPVFAPRNSAPDGLIGHDPQTCIASVLGDLRIMRIAMVAEVVSPFCSVPFFFPAPAAVLSRFRVLGPCRFWGPFLSRKKA